MTGGGGEYSVDEVSLPSHYAFHMYSKPPPPVVYFNVFTSFKKGKNEIFGLFLRVWDCWRDQSFP